MRFVVSREPRAVPDASLLDAQTARCQRCRRQQAEAGKTAGAQL